MTTKLTPDTLKQFVEKHLFTVENDTVPYSIYIAYHNQLHLELEIKVSGLNELDFIINWVEEFGTNYQVNVVYEIADDKPVVSGLTFWYDMDDTENLDWETT